VHGQGLVSASQSVQREPLVDQRFGRQFGQRQLVPLAEPPHHLLVHGQGLVSASQLVQRDPLVEQRFGGRFGQGQLVPLAELPHDLLVDLQFGLTILKKITGQLGSNHHRVGDGFRCGGVGHVIGIFVFQFQDLADGGKLALVDPFQRRGEPCLRGPKRYRCGQRHRRRSDGPHHQTLVGRQVVDVPALVPPRGQETQTHQLSQSVGVSPLAGNGTARRVKFIRKPGEQLGARKVPGAQDQGPVDVEEGPVIEAVPLAEPAELLQFHPDQSLGEFLFVLSFQRARGGQFISHRAERHLMSDRQQQRPFEMDGRSAAPGEQPMHVHRVLRRHAAFRLTTDRFRQFDGLRVAQRLELPRHPTQWSGETGAGGQLKHDAGRPSRVRDRAQNLQRVLLFADFRPHVGQVVQDPHVDSGDVTQEFEQGME